MRPADCMNSLRVNRPAPCNAGAGQRRPFRQLLLFIMLFLRHEASGRFRSGEQPAQGGGKIRAVPTLNAGAGTAVMTLCIHFTDSDAQ